MSESSMRKSLAARGCCASLGFMPRRGAYFRGLVGLGRACLPRWGVSRLWLALGSAGTTATAGKREGTSGGTDYEAACVRRHCASVTRYPCWEGSGRVIPGRATHR